MIEMARFTAPLCKGSCRRKPTEGLFLQPLSARPASVLRTLANPSNRCAVSEPLSARTASMLRILANPFTQGSLKNLHKLPDN